MEIYFLSVVKVLVIEKKNINPFSNNILVSTLWPKFKDQRMTSYINYLTFVKQGSHIEIKVCYKGILITIVLHSQTIITTPSVINHIYIYKKHTKCNKCNIKQSLNKKQFSYIIADYMHLNLHVAKGKNRMCLEGKSAHVFSNPPQCCSMLS